MPSAGLPGQGTERQPRVSTGAECSVHAASEAAVGPGCPPLTASISRYWFVWRHWIIGLEWSELEGILKIISF